MSDQPTGEGPKVLHPSGYCTPPAGGPSAIAAAIRNGTVPGPGCCRATAGTVTLQVLTAPAADLNVTLAAETSTTVPNNTADGSATVAPTTDPVAVVPPPPPAIVLLDNDFVVHIGTVNGSGSQSANIVLNRSIKDMGVPTSGKNLFPSNIAGMPTWYTIRVNKDGWLGRKRDVDILVAMNEETAVADLQDLRPGSVCISPVELKLEQVRTDVIHYQVPFNELVVGTTDNTKLRKLLVNMIYVGVLGQLLEMDFKVIEAAIRRQFPKKESAIKSNLAALEKGRDWAAKNLPKKDRFVVRPMDKTAGKILIDGNSATAMGFLFGGVSVVTWYPITPSSSVCEHLEAYLKKHRTNADGTQTFAVVQAEDELAAVGMAIGAGWAGARAMTATSGPGISLMAEFVGLAYFTEIPVVIVDVQRVGPSTGLPTRTAQGDLSFVYQLSHGDTKHLVLIPGNVEECYTMAMDALDLADRFQTPVFILSDLDLGMNTFLADQFKYPERPLDRGKVLSAEQLAAAGKFERYRDVDGDGICARTLPGTNSPIAGYFNRGSGHNEKAGYSERPADYRNLVDRLSRKHDTARGAVPAPVLQTNDKAKVGIIAFGSSDSAVQEARHILGQGGLETSYLRVRALPFNDALRAFLQGHERIYVVEQNRDGQMRDIIALEVPELATRLVSIKHYNGLPIHARFVVDAISEKEAAHVS